MIGSFVFAFASTTWEFLLGPVVEILNGTSFIAMRSLASKLVASDELGKVNSLFGVCESLMPLLYAPMYTQVYKATIDTFPGLFYLLGGGLTFPAVIIFLWLYVIDKRIARNANNGIIAVEPISDQKEVQEITDQVSVSGNSETTVYPEAQETSMEIIEIKKESSALQ